MEGKAKSKTYSNMLSQAHAEKLVVPFDELKTMGLTDAGLARIRQFLPM
jgi:hypothetical protein